MDGTLSVPSYHMAIGGGKKKDNSFWSFFYWARSLALKYWASEPIKEVW